MYILSYVIGSIGLILAVTVGLLHDEIRNPWGAVLIFLAGLLVGVSIFVAYATGFKDAEKKKAEAEIEPETTIEDPLGSEHVTVEITEPEETPAEATTSEPAVQHIFTEDDIIHLAKTVWGEARGCSKTHQAAVVWCILNRVDCENLAYMPDDIISVVTQKNQFSGYNEENPVLEEHLELVIDVLLRWEKEKTTGVSDGRVLPKEYMWFHGDGKVNHFRSSYKGGSRWDWSLESPYGD